MAFRGAFHARRYCIRAKGSAVYLAQRQSAASVKRAKRRPGTWYRPNGVATSLMFRDNTALGIISMTIEMLRLEEA